MLLVFISLTLTSDVHKPRILVIGCHSLLRIAVRIEIMCVKSMEIKIMSNVSSLSCPLSLPAFSVPLLSVFFFPPLLLFQPHVTFVPVWVTAIRVTWARLSVGGLVAGWLARRSGGLCSTQQLRTKLE